MGEVFEDVVAENRRLRAEIKELRGQLMGFESSRWWRLHPRFALRRLRHRVRSADGIGTDAMSPRKVTRAARVWKLKAEHDRRNVGCPADELVLREGIRLRLHPESRFPFEEFCYIAPEMVDEMDSFIANISDKHRLLDVGALHGLFSLVFAARDSANEVVAVDASPLAFAKLLYNIHANSARNITAVESALSDNSGMLEMHYDWEHAVAGDRSPTHRSLRVESQTGDRLCEAYSFAPDVIKVDVEGHEVKVVEGLRETIARNKPLLFLELHPLMISRNDGNGSVAELIRTLAEVGYGTAELHGRAVSVEALIDVDEIERIVLRPNSSARA
jgi:FkbM family methyltransferase